MSEGSLISINTLCKSFGDRVIFHNLSLELKAGRVYLISGSNGVGKTTLFRLISGLDKDFDGEISVNGEIAAAFQEHRLFSHVSALTNASVAASDKGLAESYLARFGFTAEDMKRRAGLLSGGQKQMCSLARAFASDRGIILLDEPSKELDAAAREVLHSVIGEERTKGKLILLISHDDGDIAVADEVIHL